VLHSLAVEVRHQPGHPDVTVLRPNIGGTAGVYHHFQLASRTDADASLAALSGLSPLLAT
jgi:hypothetical protein